MRRIAHLVNPVNTPAGSDLAIAQPITFESMRRARDHAAGGVDVRLLVTAHAADRAIMPDGFDVTPDLERSVLDLSDFLRPRPLPLLVDVLDRLHDASEGASHLVYTNVDIALLPHFYTAISAMIDAGDEAFTINRRTIHGFDDPAQLDLMYGAIGDAHPGHDCFVFPREHYREYVLGRVCLGAPGVGLSLLANMACHAARFREHRDQHLTFHIGNDRRWRDPAHADYRRFNMAELLEVFSHLEERFGPLEDKPEIRGLVRDTRRNLGRAAAVRGAIGRLIRGTDRGGPRRG